jgi:Flp pilus assembly protein TadG
MKSSHPNHNRGQSMVEMALLLPVLLLLSVVTIDIGRGIYYYSVIFNAAREGARSGIVNYSVIDGVVVLNDDDLDRIDTDARNKAIGLDPINLHIYPVIINSGLTIQVTVEYKFELVTPLAILFKNDGYFDLSTRSSMRIER